MDPTFSVQYLLIVIFFLIKIQHFENLSPQDHLPDDSLDHGVTGPSAVTLINQLVMSAAAIQVHVLICRLG